MRVLAYGLVVVLALELALWEAFLVPLRVAGVLVPVAAVAALVGNVALGRAGGRLAGRPGAAVPGVLWFVVAGLLQARGPGSDVIVPAYWTAYAWLGVGTLTAAVMVGAVPRTVSA